VAEASTEGAPSSLRRLLRSGEHIGQLEPFGRHFALNSSVRLQLDQGPACNVIIAQAAFDAAVEHWPDQRFTLRQGIMLIREHPRG
jgi:hypothetical protein